MSPYRLAVEVEPDEGGYHAVVIDLSDDAVLYVGDSYSRPEEAENAARLWIASNQ